MSARLDHEFDEQFQMFVNEMDKHCRCCEKERPCDGVLAGGLCDEIKDDRDESVWNDEDE